MQAFPTDEQLTTFLVAAKQRTYASGGSESASAVTPILTGSHQLEYTSEDFLYRDIYFGEAHFAGLEVVYSSALPIWSMCYAGGWTAELSADEAARLTGLLQAALRQVPVDSPLRGPAELSDPPYRYRTSVTGDVNRFEGNEIMEREGTVLYRLSYTGGRLD